MQKLITILKLLGSMAEDFLIAFGLYLTITATFMVSKVAGIYAVGFICLGMGIILARKPPKAR